VGEVEIAIGELASLGDGTFTSNSWTCVERDCAWQANDCISPADDWPDVERRIAAAAEGGRALTQR